MKVLIALQLMVFVLISFSEKNGLNPYRFKHYERYMYDYKETFRGEKATGRYEIVISISGEEYEVSISGKYREWEGVISNRFKNAEELAGFVLMKSYFDHYWLIPLTRTLFSKTLVKVLGSREVELSPGVKEIDKDTFRVVKECKFGGLEGVMMEVWHKKEVVFKLCLTPYTSLPTYVYKKTDEGNVYEIELLEYSDLK